MRKSFVLYTKTYDLIEELTTEQKGKLLEAVFCYQLETELPELDPLTNIVFKSIKSYLDENNKKYAEKCERLKKNALKGGAPVGNSNAKKEEKQPNRDENNQIETKNNQIDGVYEYESVSVYEYESDNNNILANENNQTKKTDAKSKRFVPPTQDEVQQYIDEMSFNINAQAFIDYYQARGWELTKNRKMKDWKAALRTWNNNNKKWNVKSEHTEISNAESKQREKYGLFEAQLFKNS